MTDKKNRELDAQVKSGDVSVAPQLAIEGARCQNGTMIYDGVLNSLSLISRGELCKLQCAIASAIENQDDKSGINENFDTTKAFQIHMPDFGKMSISKLIRMLDDIVQGALNSDLSDSPLKATGGQYNYASRRTSGDRSIKQHRAMAIKAFEEYAGDYLISCSSPIRVYALKKKATPEELLRRVKDVELKKIVEIRLKQEEALKGIEAQKKELEAKLKNATAREARIKRKLAKK